MKVIDLLNKIANGEKVPKKIKCLGVIYEYCDNDKFYYQNGYSMYRDFYTEGNCLDEEVEIIEEEKIIFEEINELSVPHKLAGNVDLGEDEKSIQYKVNQLIRNQKKIIDELRELKKGE